MFNKFFSELSRLKEEHGLGIALILLGLSIILAIGLFCFQGWAVMVLWNEFMVNVLSLPEINFWFACVLITLCHFLFKENWFSASKEKE